ncbi:demethylmenaquinone methyltransferase / 2-methoxy-6-polyprenyl-1,4-benzoquinol methylase [Verrucomicrobium sp. GAS474]|uniref:class I SAM-dependent methyltransferase n=1 Tax=Verrucomicrobium sp. GAS474 TaxID=1882831 RepID=UPI00087A4358|nr:class I SAM-dependent methyltransferase [Verrucomicrobium sp. GAS474]SDT89608.1 demethylmenaquinone methyltransferase / 2-methoxy-6-polyprenyl-1,4-benzoquinol methylase [Verrucomicrobium sp. GAS474]
MTTAPQQERTKVQAMFNRVAPRYDFLNRLLSGGRDKAWRRALTREVARQKPARLLDLATGSGDVLRALREDGALADSGVSLGADFCLPMLEEARKKGIGPLVLADGLRLPFADGSFDAVTIAFGFRNLEDRAAGLREIGRVLAPGGVLYILEFSHPWPVFAPFYFFYLRHFLPTLAAAVGAPREAYTYLGDSIRAFPSQSRLAALLKECGFAEAGWRNLTGGIVALHRGRK